MDICEIGLTVVFLALGYIIVCALAVLIREVFF